MKKICTTVEQSKKLIELGLDIETSDMYWDFQETGYILIADELGYYHNDSEIPAWSLTALLNLLPEELELLSDEDVFVPTLSRYYDDKSKFICCYDNGGCEHWYIEDSPVDAVYNMLVWTIENGYFKTNSQTESK